MAGSAFSCQSPGSPAALPTLPSLLSFCLPPSGGVTHGRRGSSQYRASGTGSQSVLRSQGLLANWRSEEAERAGWGWSLPVSLGFPHPPHPAGTDCSGLAACSEDRGLAVSGFRGLFSSP